MNEWSNELILEVKDLIPSFTFVDFKCKETTIFHLKIIVGLEYMAWLGPNIFFTKKHNETKKKKEKNCNPGLSDNFSFGNPYIAISEPIFAFLYCPIPLSVVVPVNFSVVFCRHPIFLLYIISRKHLTNLSNFALIHWFWLFEPIFLSRCPFFSWFLLIQHCSL